MPTTIWRGMMYGWLAAGSVSEQHGLVSLKMCFAWFAAHRVFCHARDIVLVN